MQIDSVEEDALLPDQTQSVQTSSILSRVQSNSNFGKSDQAVVKEKAFKTSQRSLRRGSGAGSPNSVACIPRYPAFDFDEQDEDHASTSAISTVSRKPETAKSSMLMPETLENSETESAKGSFECEVPEANTVTEAPPIPVPEKAFPNIPNSLLLKLGMKSDSNLSNTLLDEQELESKFLTLAMAFKTDRVTLPKRLEVQKRQRDIAEKDVENEINAIKASLNNLSLNAGSSETRDLITKLQTHVDIVHLATSKVSARSETYGAVKQEERLSGAFEVMMLHVENLKRLFDKEHKELEETKQLLNGTQASKRETGRLDGSVEEHRRSLKTFGLAIGSIKSVVRRRASVAEFSHISSQIAPNTKSFIMSHNLSSGVEVECGSHLLNAVSPLTSSNSVAMPSNSPCTPSYIPYTRSSNQVSGSRRCSLPINQLKGSSVTSKNPVTKRMDMLINKSSELKISMIPSLSPVVDEEIDECETDLKQASSDDLGNDIESEVANDETEELDAEWEKQKLLRLEEPFTESSSPCDNNNAGEATVSKSQTYDQSFIDYLGCLYAVHNIWTTSSYMTLLRYSISLMLAVIAVIALVITWWPKSSH